MEALYVALGGAAGCLARYGVVQAALRWRPEVPAGTALVNVAGSLAIGLLLPLVALRGPAWARPLLVIGFLGGFTTMSSFAGDVVALVRDGRYGEAFGFWAAGAVACPLAAFIAYSVTTTVRS